MHPRVTWKKIYVTALPASPFPTPSSYPEGNFDVEKAGRGEFNIIVKVDVKIQEITQKTLAYKCLNLLKIHPEYFGPNTCSFLTGNKAKN